MPNPFHNVVLTGTDYLATATISQVLSANGGTFSISSGNVWAQLEYPTPFPGSPRSGYGSTQWGTELPMGTGPGFIPAGVTGIRFRNQDASTPATVSAAIVGPNEPYIFSSNSDVSVSGLSVNVQHNGVLVGTRATIDFIDDVANVWTVVDDAANTRVTVTPPQVITGSVNADGSIAAGTGFTITKLATAGEYTINFSTAFAVSPVVMVIAVAPDNQVRLAQLMAVPTTTAVSLVMWNLSPIGSTNTPFHFLAYART